MQHSWAKPVGMGAAAATAAFVGAVSITTRDPTMLAFGILAAGGFLLVARFL